MAKIQNANAKSWRGYGAVGTLIHGWWESKMGHPTWGDSLEVSHKAEYTLTLQSNNLRSLVFTHLSSKLVSLKQLCIRTFVIALLIVAKTWKQRINPPVGERINKQWSIQIMNSIQP